MNTPPSPAEFYRSHRPEYFSDSETVEAIVLPREHLAFELDQIATNQKQDSFETFCRRLAEKFIAPNLIPQVGPTGGGDAKVDSQTHPVSDEVADRWFIPNNAWDKDQKWAFAISAKKEWKGKLKSDVAKIVATGRGYTLIYFMTNQAVAAKKKAEAESEMKQQFAIDVIILDREWMLEKIYTNTITDLAVDSLNLSSAYKQSAKTIGPKDAVRLKMLTELEEKISDVNRYGFKDFQLVEDCLQAAILSRILEKPREEVDGRFQRALRFCDEVNNQRQRGRVHYQWAWTNMYWYNDYKSFIREFNSYKSTLSAFPSATDLELYSNMVTSLRGLSLLQPDEIAALGVSFPDEETKFIDFLTTVANEVDRKCLSLIAKSHLAIHRAMDALDQGGSADEYLENLRTYFNDSQEFIEYPFELFRPLTDVLGKALPDNKTFDTLVDTVASISEKRSSLRTAGEAFFRRGLQKREAKLHKESVVYFGKAVLKLAKEETQEDLFHVLFALGESYASLGLIYAANNCLASACNIALDEFRQNGILRRQAYDCARLLATHELLIGRVAPFLAWQNALWTFADRLNLVNDNQALGMVDAFLSVRLLNAKGQDDMIAMLPDILEQQALWLSLDACRYKLGYVELIENLYAKVDVKNETEAHRYFEMLADQPFEDQTIHPVDFMDENMVRQTSIILGCRFNVSFERNPNTMMIADMLLAFLESFFSTSLDEVQPNMESVEIEIKTTGASSFLFSAKGVASNTYQLEVDPRIVETDYRSKFQSAVFDFIALILSRNFAGGTRSYLDTLFKKEEVVERLALVFEYKKFIINILGDPAELLFHTWVKPGMKTFPTKRTTPLQFGKVFRDDERKATELKTAGHDKRTIISIVDNTLWDAAKWRGFGFFADAEGLGVFMAFENEDAGQKIFDGWIEKFGREDKNEVIKITIVKGVDKLNPHWYRVHISKSLDLDVFKTTDLVIAASRNLEMTPNSPVNLTNLIEGFKYFKKFRFCPVKLVDKQRGGIVPYLEKSIVKKALFIKNAWELGVNDLEAVIIRKGDRPIIPDHVKNAPVLEVLKKRETDPIQNKQ